MSTEKDIIIYQTADGQTQLDVRLENETVWLNAQQMAELFDRDYKTIRKHINNAIKEELADSVVVAKFATTTQHGAISGKTQTHDVQYYNLDVIISVGYRVKSQRGVQFRQWANRILKEYLVKGYAVNKNIRKEHMGELRQLVQVIGRTIEQHPIAENDENKALFDIVVDYTYALDTLDDYDYQRIGILYNPDGSKRISDSTLVALTLMIAESSTEEKDVMVKVVVNLINQDNQEQKKV